MKKHRKVLVTGSGGMVGHYVEKVFRDTDLVLTGLSGNCARLDVSDPEATEDMILKCKPGVVLHLAAATDVDKCETDCAWARRVNIEGTRNVARACKKTKALMVYISSGSVFSGRLNRPARETDTPDPVNLYGISKLDGEKEVEMALGRHLIVRAGWMLGGGPEKDKKFIGKIMKKILSGEKHLKVINDKFGSPVYAKDLLEGIKVLLDKNLTGIFHMANETSADSSRYDITVAIRDILGLKDLVIEPVSSAAFELAAPRAMSEEIENFRLKEMSLDIMRPWREALKEYLLEEWKLYVKADSADARI